jgi:methylmalonyl-CoA mutase cobalamin-binding domain/chain
MDDWSELRSQFTDLLLNGDSTEVVSWAQGILAQGLQPINFFNDVFTPAMTEVGMQFARLEIFLPELLDAAEKAKAVSDQVVKPALAEKNDDTNTSRGTVIMASVQGDLHDIGKNMVSLLLQVNGFEVVDMGVDVPPRRILDKAKEVGADIVGLSSLMTTSMPYMKEVVALRDGFGLKDSFAVIVGGAPITPEYSSQIGADAFGRDAVDGVRKCTELMVRRS